MANQPYRIPHTGVPTSKSAEEILKRALDQDEPVFVIRAKDIFAPQVVQLYKELIEMEGPVNDDQVREIEQIIIAMRSWQVDHAEKVRYPD